MPQKEVGKRSSIFFCSGLFRSPFGHFFLIFLSLFSSLFCQTPFAGLLLRQGDYLLMEWLCKSFARGDQARDANPTKKARLLWDKPRRNDYEKEFPEIETLLPVQLALSSTFKTNVQNLCRTFSGPQSHLSSKLSENCANTTSVQFVRKNWGSPESLRECPAHEFYIIFAAKRNFLKICGCTGQKCLNRESKLMICSPRVANGMVFFSPENSSLIPFWGYGAGK